ncbi:hypothetical protein AB1Y20_006604 [Prymnesium parvum]|uniref:Centrosomal protein of 162 kDa n=1 Tax=Prymnesium parvum TaxID=97485 RepID=A0AB34J0U5_PRYPA
MPSSDEEPPPDEPPAFQQWKPQRQPPTLEQRRQLRDAIRAADPLGPPAASLARVSSAPAKGKATAGAGRTRRSSGPQLTALKASQREHEHGGRLAGGLKGALAAEKPLLCGAPLHRLCDEESLEARVEELKKKLLQSEAENKMMRVAQERETRRADRATRQLEDAIHNGMLVNMAAAPPQQNTQLLAKLKAKTRELEGELKNKEAQLDKLTGQTKGVRMGELRVQAMVYYEEARRLQAYLEVQEKEKEKEIERIHNEHKQVLRRKEGELESMRAEQEKMRKQNVALDNELGRWMEENDALRDAIRSLEGKSQPAKEAVEKSRGELRALEAMLRDKERDLAEMQTSTEQAFADMNAEVVRLHRELEEERARSKKLEKLNRKYCDELATANARLLRGAQPVDAASKNAAAARDDSRKP